MADSKKVVIVEDDKLFSKICADGLRKKGFEVEQAYSGEDGVTLIIQHDPDLVLLDLIMPGMEGVEVLKRLQADYKGNAYLVVLSNLSDGENIAFALGAGANEYLIKSNVSIDEVIEKAASWLA